MRHHKLFYGSSYDRGLEHLLKMWPEIKAAYPDATLDICYGWNLFDTVFFNNPERLLWKEKMVKLMKQDGITDHGRVSKDKLQKVREQCGIWAYPTHFTEINCITALESQACGLVPVTIALAALQETVGSGVLVDGDIYEAETYKLYLNKLLDLMGNPDQWKKESKKAKQFAKDYDWSKIAQKWHEDFKTKDQSIKVTIYTPTVRKGFWNIMAHNLSKQTYKNFEWLIIDDAKEDRSHLAKECAKRYGLDVVYCKGKKRSLKRTYGLVNANNTALERSSGQLLVFLQDFIVLPEDGIEQLVLLHRKNPDALIAPVDMYVAPRIKPDIDSEDWFNGETNVLGEFIRQNIRIKNEGLRFTENPYDFEQNYGAIPVKVAKALGGWWEFLDFGLGYDNTIIAYMALQAGYKILLDETNIAICIDHWAALKGTRENVLGRARRLNDPLYVWAINMIEQGKLPLRRTQEIDDQIQLSYEIPESVNDEDVVKWINENSPAIVESWLKQYEKGFK